MKFIAEQKDPINIYANFNVVIMSGEYDKWNDTELWFVF